MNISPFAGKLPESKDLVDIAQLLHAYEADQPDVSVPSQLVSFGTSGHRGSSFDRSFNRNHILCITQSICTYRKIHKITGPLFMGFDTHALSQPAFETALEVLSANGVNVVIAKNHEFTPTPVISHAILAYNKNRDQELADGIVITPSHNPPREGGFKYNPPHGGPAEKEITDWIEKQANEFLAKPLEHVQVIPFTQAVKQATTHHYDFLRPFIRDLRNIVDMDIIHGSQIKIAVDPMGGAGVHYWQPIADLYKIDLSVLNTKVDPCFRFMTRDWDGQIRMDPSSKYAMKSLLQEASKYDISFACDTDHDRHGIVTKTAGLMPPNQYLATAICYLFKHRPDWPSNAMVGKTSVSSQMIDRVTNQAQRSVYEVPVGFKWFVDGLLHSTLAFSGEESAGATFLRRDGSVWTTDKDGFAPALLAAEITAKMGKDPAVIYQELCKNLGETFYRRIEAPASTEQKEKFKHFDAQSPGTDKKIAGDKIEKFLTRAPGNKASLGGFKIETKNGWLAARPSGTEEIYKIYAESFQSEKHLDQLLHDGQEFVDGMFKGDGEKIPVISA